MRLGIMSMIFLGLVFITSVSALLSYYLAEGYDNYQPVDYDAEDIKSYQQLSKLYNDSREIRDNTDETADNPADDYDVDSFLRAGKASAQTAGNSLAMLPAMTSDAVGSVGFTDKYGNIIMNSLFVALVTIVFVGFFTAAYFKWKS